MAVTTSGCAPFRLPAIIRMTWYLQVTEESLPASGCCCFCFCFNRIVIFFFILV